MTLSEVKLRIKETPISSILTHFISLTPKSQDQFLALCPFHHDTRPSLHIHDGKGLFRCFVCDIGGDAITFVERFAQLGFIEAIHEIGKVIGIPTDDLLNDRNDKDPKYEIAYWLLKKATLIFQNCGNLPHFKAPFENFINERKLTQKTVENFDLGFAPNTNVILSFINEIPDEQKRAKVQAIALEIGLIRESYPDRTGKKELFDVFRDRIIFPTRDSFGRVVGFSSRAIHSYQKAKYYNSKESFIFNKRSLLYGINLAKPNIKSKGRVILAEGHMDVIMLHQQGFNEAVAVMGTALTGKSLELLKGLTKNIYLGLDSDPAGIAAAKRAHEELIKLGIVSKFIDFSPHKDPDEFLKELGADNLEKLLNKSPLFISKLIDETIEKSSGSDISQKQETLKDLFKILSPLKLEIIATEKLIEIREKLDLQTDQQQLLENYKYFLSETGLLAPTKATPPKLSQNQRSYVARPKVLKKTESRYNKTEKSLIKELILHPSLLHKEEMTQLLENVVENDVKRLFQWLKSLYYEIDESDYAETVVNYLTKEQFGHEIRSIVGSTLFQYRYQVDLDEGKLVKKLVRDFKNQFLKEKLIKDKEALLIRERSVENENEAREIMLELARIQKEIINISINK